MDLELKNKVAIVTGGSHGIGRAIALRLAAEGCFVCVCSRDEHHLDAVRKEVECLGAECLPIVCNVHNMSEIDIVVSKVTACRDTIHILVNNVGGGGRWGSEDVLATSDDVWEEVYEKNVTAMWRFTKNVLPYMVKQNWGRIITITSIYGKEAGGRAWFNVAKAAQTTLTKNLARNPSLVRHGVTLNSVAPGGVMIPDTGWEKEKENNPDRFAQQMEDLPMGRLGEPDEIAPLVSFLCSDYASFINGACIAVDGGASHAF